MPNVYKRKTTAGRGAWSEISLKQAMDAVKNASMTAYTAAIHYNIPRKTLERRLKNDDDSKGPMGPSSTFGVENEKRLCNHIKDMQAKAFPITVDDLRRIAYEFAEQLHIKHRFNHTTEKAGYDWIQLFLKRNPDIKLRKSEGVSYARSQGMNRSEVNSYFLLLEKTLTENEILDKPGHVYNMDETGLQLNNRPGHVLAEKGSKAVPMSTSTEKGETITVIACCNAEGTFLPPAAIMKGKYKKPQFDDGFPPGSRIFMSQKSAYITSEIFLEWLKVHFVPRKLAGKVLLLLDGHSTHCNSVEMLEYAKENDIELLSMPSHTSHYLQPLDVAVFKSLKTHFYEACRLWMKQNPGRRITRYEFGSLLNQGWGKSASSENAVSGFRATGVMPLNPRAIPEYAFSSGTEQTVEASQQTGEAVRPTGKAARQTVEAARQTGEAAQCGPTETSKPTKMVVSNTTSGSTPITSASIKPITPEKPQILLNTSDTAVPSTSGIQSSKNTPTPSRLLKQISPVPQKVYEVRKRAKQVGILLTSEEHIVKRKSKENQENLKLIKKKIKSEPVIQIKQEKKTVRKRKALRKISESSCEEDDDVIIYNDESDDEEKEEDNCRGCGQNYYKTQLIEDWLQCTICLLWVHENCTEFDDMCFICGNRKKKEQNEAKISRKGKGRGKRSTGHLTLSPKAITPGHAGRDGQT